MAPEKPSPVEDNAAEVSPYHSAGVVAASQPQVTQEEDEGGEGEGEASQLANGG